MTTSARNDLREAAARLFAEQGIDAPSLREITRAAGQRNTGALQYHFGGRDDLLRAVLAEHSAAVEQARGALLDEHVRFGDPTLEGLVDVLVLPLVAKLDGGTQFLRIAAEVVGRPRRFPGAIEDLLSTPSMVRWTDAIAGFLPTAAPGRPLHRRSTAVRFVYSEFARRAAEPHSGDHRLFASHLADLVIALLTAPLSTRTARLIR